MASFLPTRTKEYWQYLPLLSIAALFWWIIGLGLWIHFTQTAYNKSLDTIDTLQITLNAGVVSQIQRVYSSLVGTCVVFTIGAICIHALGIFKGLADVEQDYKGQLDPYKGGIILWCNVSLQVAWWMVLVWMVVMLIGYGAFAAFIYAVRTSLINVLLLQGLLPGGLNPIPLPGYCPYACLSTVSTGVFLYFTDAHNTGGRVCLCDHLTLQAAHNAAEDAFKAVPGMLIGVLFMVVYGVVLLTYLTSMLTRTSTERDLVERFSQQMPGCGAPAAKNKQQIAARWQRQDSFT